MCSISLQQTNSHLLIPLYNNNSPGFNKPAIKQTGNGTDDEYQQPAGRESTDIKEKESVQPKKKVKGKVREAIKAVGKEMMVHREETTHGEKAVNLDTACGIHKANHGTINHVTRLVFPFLSSLLLSSMLTLNLSTLFHFSLNNRPEPFKKGMNSWATHVKDLSNNRLKPNSKLAVSSPIALWYFKIHSCQ